MPQTRFVGIRVPLDLHRELDRMQAAYSREHGLKRPLGIGPLLLQLARPEIEKARQRGGPSRALAMSTKEVKVKLPMDVYWDLDAIQAAYSRQQGLGVGPLLFELAKPEIERARQRGGIVPDDRPA